MKSFEKTALICRDLKPLHFKEIERYKNVLVANLELLIYQNFTETLAASGVVKKPAGVVKASLDR